MPISSSNRLRRSLGHLVYLSALAFHPGHRRCPSNRRMVPGFKPPLPKTRYFLFASRVTSPATPHLRCTAIFMLIGHSFGGPHFRLQSITEMHLSSASTMRAIRVSVRASHCRFSLYGRWAVRSRCIGWRVNALPGQCGRLLVGGTWGPLNFGLACCRDKFFLPMRDAACLCWSSVNWCFQGSIRSASFLYFLDKMSGHWPRPFYLRTDTSRLRSTNRMIQRSSVARQSPQSKESRLAAATKRSI
jgi:hypothetical protein